MGTEIVVTAVGLADSMSTELADSHKWKGTLLLSCAPNKTGANSIPVKADRHVPQAIEMTWLRLNHQYAGARKNTLKTACPFADVGSDIDSDRQD